MERASFNGVTVEFGCIKIGKFLLMLKMKNSELATSGSEQSEEGGADISTSPSESFLVASVVAAAGAEDGAAADSVGEEALPSSNGGNLASSLVLSINLFISISASSNPSLSFLIMA
ncbi:hypothetical protein WICPIJ_001946 [Wickerhamomyces pijperi]|uniref:Uncharacterized protein n=1 Tax=Wickerhamomyces pijperi TaxID=599730 RepID=A0A9P8QAL9_WICPI|nr:hypothetical protein WICPIJ_001946 [Wickerhamomyces pijperi]